MNQLTQGEYKARGLAAIFNALFAGMDRDVELAGHGVKRVVQGLTIGALTVAIRLIRSRNQLRDTLDAPGLIRGLDAAALCVASVAFLALATAAALPWLLAGLVVRAFRRARRA